MKDVLNATQTVASACLLLLGLQGLFGSVAPAVSKVFPDPNDDRPALEARR